MRKIIGLDFDDTLFEFMNPFLEWHNKKYGTNFSKNKLGGYDFWNFFGISKDEAVRRVSEFYESDEQRGLTPISGAIEELKRISRKNEIVVISSRPVSTYKVVSDMIREHLDGSVSGIYLMGHFGKGEQRRLTKADLCRRRGIEVMIDDSYDVISDCQNKGVSGVIVTQPWNQDADVSGKTLRITDISGLSQALERVFSYH